MRKIRKIQQIPKSNVNSEQTHTHTKERRKKNRLKTNTQRLACSWYMVGRNVCVYPNVIVIIIISRKEERENDKNTSNASAIRGQGRNGD